MHIELPTRFGTIWAATGGKPFDPALPTVALHHVSGLAAGSFSSMRRPRLSRDAKYTRHGALKAYSSSRVVFNAIIPHAH